MKWQPIETAPDDIDVLVWCADRERGYIGYQSWGIVQMRDTDDTVLRPTHWMPLPTAPTT